MFKNKKGFELSINFVVMLILAMAVLSGSLVLVYKLFNSADNLKATISYQTQQEIKNLLMSGEKVAIPETTQNVRKTKPASFGIGILNILGVEADFTVTVSQSVVGECTTLLNMISKPTQTITLKNNEQQTLLAAFDTNNAVKGCTYVFNVEVTCGGACPYEEGNRYVPLQKIYVKVD